MKEVKIEIKFYIRIHSLNSIPLVTHTVIKGLRKFISCLFKVL